MKVVFLDVDGVLNDATSINALLEDAPTKEHLDCLKEIIDATDAKVVLTSSWRLYPHAYKIAKKCLRDIGSDVYSRTKELSKGRGAEIEEWLSRHPKVEKFVILDDDDSEMKKFSKNMVKTTFFRGLLPEHVKKAISILNAK